MRIPFYCLLLFIIASCSGDSDVLPNAPTESTDESNETGDDTSAELGAYFVKSVSGGLQSRAYSYNDDGKLQSVSFHTSEYEMVYDNDGTLTEVLLLDTFEYDGGELISYRKYVVTAHSATQFNVEIGVYNGADELIEFEQEVQITYDGPLIKKHRRLTPGGGDETRDYFHDENGRLLRVDQSFSGTYYDTEWQVTEWDDTPLPHLQSMLILGGPLVLFPDKYVSEYGIKTGIDKNGDPHVFDYDFTKLDEGEYTVTRTLPYREDDYVVRFGREMADTDQ